ncbi:MAG: cytochrome C oxidase subunit IV family protein [Vicinamibacterales bacterium]
MAEHSTHHIVPKSTYYLIFTLLMVGTALTWWVATIDLGMMNNVLMLGIAVTKATLVVMFFMHVKYSSKLIWLAVGTSVFFLLILIVLTLNDYLARGWYTYG